MKPAAGIASAMLPPGRSPFRISLPLLWCVLALAGCGHVASATDESATRAGQRVEALVWPKPPAPARIRFVRLIDMEGRPRSRSLGDHVTVARALQARDPEAAIEALRQHITRKMQDIVDVVRRGIARIYVNDFDRHVSAD